VLTAWLIAFAFTQAVEVPIYLWATGGRFGVSFLASTLTHPVVWFVFPYALLRAELLLGVDFGLPGYVAMVAAAEFFAWLVEGLWLERFGVRRPLLMSLLANGSSLSLGLLSRALFDVP